MNIKINSFQHLGIPVTDLNRSRAFYERLGFKDVMSSTFEFNGDTGNVAMMKRDDMIIEIYQMPEKELEAVRTRKDGHVDHMAFDVDDIETAFHTLKEEGFHIVEDAPVYLPFWKKGCRYFNIAGPDGERLEFNQIIK